MTLVFCWSHVRRGFYDLARGKAAPIATEALARIAALYRIEAGIRGKDAGHRLAVCQAESQRLVADLRAWLEVQLARLPARGPTAEAIRYALNHWDGVERFLDDGRIEMDSNSIERAMRPVVLSRKKRPVRRQRRGWRAMGGHCLAGRDLQAQRGQFANLLRRPAHQPRQRLATGTHRRTHALELATNRNLTGGKGHGTTLTV